MMGKKILNSAWRPVNYTAYGHASGAEHWGAGLRYAGEYCFGDMYLLGAGYRAYHPGLMRFCSADEHSPFGLGGINAYAYCSGDPINFSDPSGRWKQQKRVAHTPKGPIAETSSVNSVDSARPQRRQDRPQPTPNRVEGLQSNHEPLLNKAGNSQTTPSSSSAAYRRRTGLIGGRDPLESRRGISEISASEAEVLNDFIKTNKRKFKSLGVERSQAARRLVIKARRFGRNPMDDLRAKFPELTNDNLDNMVLSVDRQITLLRQS